MNVMPQAVPLHEVDTSKGRWGIFVQSIVEAVNGENLFVTIIFEQNIDDEHIKSRRLKMSVSALELASPSGRNGVLNQIREWIDTTEGDGFLCGK